MPAISVSATPIVELALGKAQPSSLCSSAELVRILTGFLDAFNAGDQAQLTRFLMHVDNYAVVGEMPDGTSHSEIETNDLGTVLAYLTQRHHHHERLALLRLIISKDRVPASVEVTYMLSRHAEDLTVATAAKDVVGGKAIINCKEQTIEGWVLDGQRYIAGP